MIVHALAVYLPDSIITITFSPASANPHRPPTNGPECCCEAADCKMTHITPILKCLHWPPIHFRIHFKVCVITYIDGAPNCQAHIYISDLLRPYIPSRLTSCPSHTIKTKGDRKFEATAPSLWNALPVDIQSVGSVTYLLR